MTTFSEMTAEQQTTIIRRLTPEAVRFAIDYSRAAPEVQRAIRICLGVLEYDADADAEAIKAIIGQLARHEITKAQAVERLESLLPGTL